MQITYRYRVRDKHAPRLNAQAAAVNFVWNYCNGMQTKAAKAGRKWLRYYDLARLTAGSTKEGLQLHAQTVRQICKPYDAFDVCGAVHDRDINAARAILRVGLHARVEGAHARKQELGSPCLQTGE